MKGDGVLVSKIYKTNFHKFKAQFTKKFFDEILQMERKKESQELRNWA